MRYRIGTCMMLILLTSCMSAGDAPQVTTTATTTTTTTFPSQTTVSETTVRITDTSATKAEISTSDAGTEVIADDEGYEIPYIDRSIADELEQHSYDLLAAELRYIESGEDIAPDITALDDPLRYDTEISPFDDLYLLNAIGAYDHGIALKNEEKFSSMLDEYNVYLQEYSYSIRAMGLTDIQTIAKVMDDQWASVEDGLGRGRYNIFGLYRLDVFMDDTSAVCRNLADDFTAKMNAIDPGYEARTVCLYSDESRYGAGSAGDIWRERTDDKDTVVHDKYIDISINNDAGNDLLYNGIPVSYTITRSADKTVNGSYNYSLNVACDKETTDYIGNHAATMIAIRDDDGKVLYHLIADPTNINISLVKDGRIYTFFDPDHKGLTLMTSGQIMLGDPGDIEAIAHAFIDSVTYTDQIDLDEIQILYDVSAFDAALEEIRAMTK
ncbi:MAG: hypothetical protein IKR73_09775 [Oscillospiraceae bacterium]|nr:hypothetical protein [Oscillospiraceae bacterium]